MSRRDETIDPTVGSQPFLSRWSQRKHSATRLKTEEITAKQAEETTPLPPGDEEMPSLDSLDAQSDFSGFLSPRVSDELRRLAMQKLFSSPAFNICDGLDDYADDFTSFSELGEIITADMRHRLQQETDKLAQVSEETDDQSNDPTPPAGQAAKETEPAVSSTEVDVNAEHQETAS